MRLKRRRKGFIKENSQSYRIQNSSFHIYKTNYIYDQSRHDSNTIRTRRSFEPFFRQKNEIVLISEQMHIQTQLYSAGVTELQRFHKKTKEQNFILNSNLFQKTFDSLLSIRNGVSRRSFPKRSSPSPFVSKSLTPFTHLGDVVPKSIYTQPTSDVDIHSWLCEFAAIMPYGLFGFIAVLFSYYSYSFYSFSFFLFVS